MKERIKTIWEFIKTNWFKIAILISLYWFIQEISYLNNLSIDIWHHSPSSSLPGLH